jgi:hypothetical protein
VKPLISLDIKEEEMEEQSHRASAGRDLATRKEIARRVRNYARSVSLTGKIEWERTTRLPRYFKE